MDAQRHLLIVGHPTYDLQQLAQGMVAHGWSIHHTGDLRQAAKLVDAHPSAVGLMYIDSRQLNKIADIESVIGGGNVKWIALFEQEPVDDAAVGQLIGHLFFAYHVLPDEGEQLDCLLSHALAMVRLEAAATSHELLERNRTQEYEMVGTTPAIHQLFKTIYKVAMVDAPVFISGESGTGKELTARAIHTHSLRAKGPFNAVNCGALPSNLIQSELFGHEKGAFTGANQRRIGRIEATTGGTLFLDEIGDLPLDMQVNLLRFLENHKIQRVGSLDEITVDVRVFAATHIDLEKAIAEGSFREDLYHRINVLQINIPPLRERQEDIELLAQFFFEKFSNERPIMVRGFSQEALTLLRQHSWPGNVRELINRIRRAMIMCEHRLIRPVDLGLERRQCSRGIVTLEQARDIAERDVVKAALARNKGKVQHAAKELGTSRVTLYRLIEKHNIARGDDSARTARKGTQKSDAGPPKLAY